MYSDLFKLYFMHSWQKVIIWSYYFNVQCKYVLSTPKAIPNYNLAHKYLCLQAAHSVNQQFEKEREDI